MLTVKLFLDMDRRSVQEQSEHLRIRQLLDILKIIMKNMEFIRETVKSTVLYRVVSE